MVAARQKRGAISKRRLILGVSLLTAVGLVGGAGVWRAIGQRDRPAPRRDGWSFPRLVERLRAHGLNYHVTPVTRGGSMENGVYLCETERSWEDVSHLPGTADHLDEWRGVVLCVWIGPDGRNGAVPSTWGDGCLELPPFAFFGDPEVRGRLEAALHDDGL
jgi:hypothetical protein